MEFVGWIMNIHFRGQKTHLWLKDEMQTVHHLELNYYPIFYVDVSKHSNVRYLLSQAQKHPFVKRVELMHAFASNESSTPSLVLKIYVVSPEKFDTTVKSFKKLGLPLYNIDLHPREKFFQDTASFPLGKCRISHEENGDFTIEMMDDFRKPFYDIIPLKVAKIRVQPFKAPNSVFPTFRDPIATIDIDLITNHCLLDTNLNPIHPVSRIDLFPCNLLEIFHLKRDWDVQSYRIHVLPSLVPFFKSLNLQNTVDSFLNRPMQVFQTMMELIMGNGGTPSFDKCFDEASALLLLNFLMMYFDPDILVIVDGDSFTLPYLQHRAISLDIRLELGRLPSRIPLHTKSQSYFSYGRFYRKNMPIFIPGRIHIDQRNSHFFNDTGFYGVIELSRLGGIPPDRCARNSIGTVLTAIELMVAARSIPPVLIPNGKAKSERFKPSETILASDNGGITYPALPGIYADVWGIDFVSLYPSIMLKHNISSETVLCECCKGDGDIVPGIGYHVCIRRRGIVPMTMQLILEKRLFYKYLQKSCVDEYLRRRYQGISNSLKWVLVSCFGYLGFKNARFGSIESHQAVTAYARKYLVDAQHICRQFGFKVLAGLTDSLFIQATESKFNTLQNISQMVFEISRQTGFAINVDGHFKWIVFTSIKGHASISALNRYFGAYDAGIKIRGILSRQHSTPEIARKLQWDMLEFMSGLATPTEIIKRIDHLIDILEKWKRKVLSYQVNRHDLVFRVRLGKSASDYVSNTVQSYAAKRYLLHGRSLGAGDTMRFIIKDNSLRSIDRVILEDELDSSSPYDAEWYSEYLDRAFLDLMENIVYQFNICLPSWLHDNLSDPPAPSLETFLSMS